MASLEEIRPRPRPVVSLVTASIARPSRSPRLITGLMSLRVQTVALLVALVVFAATMISISESASRASTDSQKEQINLVTWRFDSVRVSLDGETLSSHLALMNNALLDSDVSSATSNRSLAESDIRLLESETSMISSLNLPADVAPLIAKDAAASQALVAFASKFIDTAPHTDSEMHAQTDAAFNAWRDERAPIDALIVAKIQSNKADQLVRDSYVRNVTLFSTVVTTILLLLLIFVQVFLTLRPVAQLAKVATKLASGESVSIKPTRRRDELGRLTSALAAWQRSSQNLVDGLRDGSSRAATSASSLSSASEQLASATAEQTAATTATAASMDELARTSTTIADTLELVASQTIKTRENLELANVDTQASGNRAQALAARIHEITGILELINQVADQTNLLALNAAIEAARAGDAGLGFAVVADEVRRLAERSKSSAAKIAMIMAGAEAESTATVMAMERSATQIQQAVTLLASVVQASGEVKVITEQQRTATEQVGEAIVRITVGSRQVSDTARKISTAAASHATLASEMEDMSRSGTRPD